MAESCANCRYFFHIPGREYGDCRKPPRPTPDEDGTSWFESVDLVHLCSSWKRGEGHCRYPPFGCPVCQNKGDKTMEFEEDAKRLGNDTDYFYAAITDDVVMVIKVTKDDWVCCLGSSEKKRRVEACRRVKDHGEPVKEKVAQAILAAYFPGIFTGNHKYRKA